MVLFEKRTTRRYLGVLYLFLACVTRLVVVCERTSRSRTISPLASIVVSLALTTTAKLDLVALEVRFVLDNLNKLYTGQ